MKYNWYKLESPRGPLLETLVDIDKSFKLFSKLIHGMTFGMLLPKDSRLNSLAILHSAWSNNMLRADHLTSSLLEDNWANLTENTRTAKNLINSVNVRILCNLIDELNVKAALVDVFFPGTKYLEWNKRTCFSGKHMLIEQNVEEIEKFIFKNSSIYGHDIHLLYQGEFTELESMDVIGVAIVLFDGDSIVWGFDPEFFRKKIVSAKGKILANIEIESPEV